MDCISIPLDDFARVLVRDFIGLEYQFRLHLRAEYDIQYLISAVVGRHDQYSRIFTADRSFNEIRIIPGVIVLRKKISRTQALFILGQFLPFLLAALVDFRFALFRISLRTDTRSEPPPVAPVFIRARFRRRVVLCFCHLFTSVFEL